MRRSALALVFLGAALFISTPSSACWLCSEKLNCQSSDCWTEWICVTNLRFNQRGFSDCWETMSGCNVEGQLCKWTTLPQENVPLFTPQEEAGQTGPLMCAAAS